VLLRNCREIVVWKRLAYFLCFEDRTSGNLLSRYDLQHATDAFGESWVRLASTSLRVRALKLTVASRGTREVSGGEGGNVSSSSWLISKYSFRSLSGRRACLVRRIDEESDGGRRLDFDNDVISLCFQRGLYLPCQGLVKSSKIIRRWLHDPKRTFRTPTMISLGKTTLHTSCTNHARLTVTDFCKPLIADSYRSPSIFRCSELKFSDLSLTHHNPDAHWWTKTDGHRRRKAL